MPMKKQPSKKNGKTSSRKKPAPKSDRKKVLLIVVSLVLALAAASVAGYFYFKSPSPPVVEKKTLTAAQLRAIYENNRKKWAASGRPYAACLTYRWDSTKAVKQGITVSVLKNKCGFPLRVRAEILHGMPVNVYTNLKAPLYSSKGVVIYPGRVYFDRWKLVNKNQPYSIPVCTFSVNPAIP